MLAPMLATVATPPDGFAPPGTEIFDFTRECLVGSGNYCVNKVSFWMLMSAVIIAALFIAAFRAPKLVPTGIQNLMEAFVDLVRNAVVIEVMGPEGLPFLPLLTSIFIFIWVNNTYGVIPGIQFPTTARMAIPVMLAVLVWLLFNIVGIVKQGGWTYIKGVLFPPGVPKPIYILVTPIEFVSVFIVRPLTLAVRLGANMIAGHLILTIFALGSFYLFAEFGQPGLAPKITGMFGFLSFGLQIFMTGFEVLVAFLQAYIFTMLTAVYISGAIHPEH
jgi:F-type H+-transporting ATPase subunit a